MLNFSLMGAGRIGKMHAKFIAAHPNAKLKYIYDVIQNSLKKYQNQQVALLRLHQKKQLMQMM